MHGACMGQCELLVVEARRLDAGLRHMGAHRLDHRGRPAQIDRDVAVVQVLRCDETRHVTLVFGGGRRVRDAEVPCESGERRGDLLDLVESHQVLVGADAVDEVRLAAVRTAQQSAEHRQHRGQSRAAGQQQHRAVVLAEEERPVGAGEGDGVANGCALTQVVRHHATRGQLHQEGEQVVVGRVGERVRPRLIGARHRDVHVLPWQEGQFGAVRDFDTKGHGGGRQSFEVPDGAGVRRRLGLGDVGGAGDLEHEIRAWLHAAGQDVPGLGLIGCQGVVDVVAAVVTAGLTQRLTGAARAVPAVQRDVDPLTVGRVGDRLVVSAGDEPGHTILEGQCDGVGFDIGATRGYCSHGLPLRSGRRPPRGGCSRS